MLFPMTLDRTQRTTTTIAIVAMVFLPLAVLLGPRHAPWPALLAVPVALVTLVVAWARAPVAVEVHPHELRVLRRLAAPLIVRASEVTAVGPGPARVQLRLCGAGGFFGNWGLFWTGGFGRYWLYTTGRGRLLAIRRRVGLPVVVGVDDDEGLRRALQGWAPFAR